MWNRSALGSLRRRRLDLIRVFQAPHTKVQPWVAVLFNCNSQKSVNNFDVIFQCLMVPRFLRLQYCCLLKNKSDLLSRLSLQGTLLTAFYQGNTLLFVACVDKQRKPDISGDKCDGLR